MESGLMSLPQDVLHIILDEIVIALETKKALRLRVVNSKWIANLYVCVSKAEVGRTPGREILYRVCKPGSIIVTREAIFSHYWRLQSMSKVFKVGLLLLRLDLSYAVQSHYLSSILEAEELLMEQSSDQTKDRRHEFRYALCAAEAWSWSLQDVFLGDIEPIFPQKKPPYGDASPLADALSAAAYMGHMDLVQKLLHKGADLNISTGYLRPPLQQAASRGHNDILLLLLSEGADINMGYRRPRDSSDCGALHLASLNGHMRTVELLLDRKDQLQSGFSISTDVVFSALEGGHLNLMKTYIETRISTYIKKYPHGVLSMLLSAVYFNHEHIVRWLLQNGVDFSKNNPHTWYRGRTPLEIAALHGRLPIARLILEYTPFRYGHALANAAQNGHVEVAKLLLDTAGEDVDTMLMLHGKKPFQKRPSYKTPLHLAAYNGEVEMVRFLLGRGIDRRLPVPSAAVRGEEEILRLLLEAEARLGRENNYTPLLELVREQTHIPKRISNLLLELSPKTRAKAASSDSAE